VAKDMTELELKYGVDVPESAVWEQAKNVQN
jgi:hypothetical protein